jgi:glycosyltransferase involved in cell wall biosynthesis
MRILLLMPSLTGTGGAERVVDGLSRLLSSAGVQVFEASFDSPGGRRRFENSAPFHPLGPLPRLPLPFRALEYLMAARRLRALKQRLKIDATISNLWRSDLVSVLSGGFDRKIALCHINVVGNSTNRMMLRMRPFVAAIYQKFDRVVAVSQPLAHELKALYRLSSRQITHIENFVDRPEVVSRLPSDGVQRFVFCGRLVPEKNVEGLLHVWREFGKDRPGVQLVIVGDGPLRGELFRLAAELGLGVGRAVDDIQSKVIFTGQASNPAEYMLGARALLLSSRAEGFGLVVLEALSLGLPVLASDCQCGGVRSVLVGHGVCNPNLERAEYAGAGALLPVPDAAKPSTLSIWREALLKVSQSDAQWTSCQEGALARACHFTSDEARRRWLEAISF